ncbi:metal ABC transporter permease [Herbaspirillum sp. RTI4]|uniref:metal ABC transporter permease n=1 Tax=Herbaspirillum sp. RTI4 TaxID=3048640 RepID=UPI002AB4AF39|nr:metal ABC transporter permease [Herbaspirillum sp. RTI4]MDY7579322.1 metal ABC transporter permease [Herbaspirillum sp. RTI4]MEA9980236.1 metal ABC transporter permease [Herbaspirillum sp. RTI4]
MTIIDTVYQFAIAPFHEFAFMRRALVGVLALALSSAPLGVLLTLRRMSLFGEALSHAVLPGVAIGFIFFGLSLPALSIGGFIAGVLVVAAAGWISRHTELKEDASLAACYLVALALGVMLISRNGTQVDLLHILFGNVLGVDTQGLLLVAGVSTVSVLILAAMYRGLLLESFDPAFLAASGMRGDLLQQVFLMLVVSNLVASFQTLGTLMAVGLMMMPAVSARLWHDTLPAQLVNSAVQAALAGYLGLMLSYYASMPSGPTIIVCAGGLYILSLLFAPRGWLPRLLRRPHLRA